MHARRKNEKPKMMIPPPKKDSTNSSRDVEPSATSMKESASLDAVARLPCNPSQRDPPVTAEYPLDEENARLHKIILPDGCTAYEHKIIGLEYTDSVDYTKVKL